MPHLQFQINRHIPDATKVVLAKRVQQLFEFKGPAQYSSSLCSDKPPHRQRLLGPARREP